MKPKFVDHCLKHFPDYLVAYILFLGILVHILGKPLWPIPYGEHQHLHIVNFLSHPPVPGGDASAHNSILLTVLLQKSSKATASRSGSDGLSLPNTNIFSAIIAAIVPILFTLRGKQANWQVFAMLLFLIALLFFLDVLKQDSFWINHQWDSITDRDIEVLAKLAPNDTTWYDLSYDGIGERFNKISDETSRGRWRKIHLACQFKVEQVVYFFVPWLIVYLFSRKTFQESLRRLRGA